MARTTPRNRSRGHDGWDSGKDRGKGRGSVCALKGSFPVFFFKTIFVFIKCSSVLRVVTSKPASLRALSSQSIACPVNCCLELCRTFVPFFFIPKQPYPESMQMALKTWCMNGFLYYSGSLIFFLIRLLSL